MNGNRFNFLHRAQDRSADGRADGVNLFYHNTNVAVFGGAGMVGRKLVGKLLDLGANVLVIDNFSRGKTIHLDANYLVQAPGSYHGYDRLSGHDIREKTRGGIAPWNVVGADASEPAFLEWHLLDSDIDAAFNLAAKVAGVLYNQRHHSKMFDANVRLLSSPLIACEQADVPAFLQTSSVCVYAPHNQSPSLEPYGLVDDPHVANIGYSEAKRAGERMLGWSSIEHAVVVRPTNVVGEMDYYDQYAHVVPAFIRRAATLGPSDVFVAHGSPSIQREFIFAGDVAEGMLAALALGENREAYNIGCSTTLSKKNCITMGDLSRTIVDLVDDAIWGRKLGRGMAFESGSGGGDPVRFSNAEKLMEIGWNPATDLSSILNIAVQDYFREVEPRWGESRLFFV